MSEELECQKCGEPMSLLDGLDPSKYCNLCTHEVIDELERQKAKLIAAADFMIEWIGTNTQSEKHAERKLRRVVEECRK